MKITDTLSDEAVLLEIGQRIAQRRLELNLTQAAVAEKAGIGKRTLERIEDGASAQTVSIVKLFRVLGLMENLERLLPEPKAKPIDLLKGKRKQRARASKQADKGGANPGWTWKEDA